MQPILRKYNTATTILFELYQTDGVDLRVDAAHASGDTTIMKDEGTPTNTTNGFVDEGEIYSLALTATEMQAARIVIKIVDQSTKVWLDKIVVIETYGHASAQHGFDFSVAVQDVNVSKWLSGTPNALQSGRVDTYIGAVAAGVIAAGSFAAGALDAVWSTATRTLTAISDSSGVTTLLARLTAIRAGLLDNLDAAISTRASQTSLDTVDDYIDTEMAAIKAKTDNLPTDPADQSLLIAAISAVETKVDTVDDLVDTEVAAIKTVVDAIKTKTDNLPLDPADASDVAGQIATSTTTIQGDVALAQLYLSAIKTRTDNLPIDPADQSLLIAAISAVETKVDTVDDLVDTEVGAIKTVTDKINTALEADGSGGFQFTTLALENAPTSGASGPTAVEIRQEIDTNSTQLAAIKAKTDNLPTDPADQSLVTAGTDAIYSRLGAPAGASIAADIATRASQSSVNTLSNYVDTEVAAILTAVADIPNIKLVTDHLETMITLDGSVYQFTVNALENAPSGGGGGGGATVAQFWNAVRTSYNANGSMGQAMNKIMDVILQKVNLISGTIILTTPLDPETFELRIIRGDSYTPTAGRTLPSWEDNADTPQWPNLTGATVTFKAQQNEGDSVVFEKTMTIDAVSGPGKVTLHLTSAESAEFKVGGNDYLYEIEMTKAGDVVTLVQGLMTVKADVR